MSDILNEIFGADEKSEQEGVIIDFGKFSMRIKHAYRTNKEYAKMLEKEMEPVRRAFENGLLSPEQADGIMHKVYAHTIVLDWNGIKDDSGKDIKYSPQTCIEYFKKYPKFFDAIKQEAENFALFKSESVKADQKNS